jgi:hypothetical protein
MRLSLSWATSVSGDPGRLQAAAVSKRPIVLKMLSGRLVTRSAFVVISEGYIATMSRVFPKAGNAFHAAAGQNAHA